MSKRIFQVSQRYLGPFSAYICEYSETYCNGCNSTIETEICHFRYVCLITDSPLRKGIVFPLISPDRQLKACSTSRTVDTVPSTTKDSAQFCIYDVFHKNTTEQ